MIVLAALTMATLPRGDWLLREEPAPARVQRVGEDLLLTNGLVSRTFRLRPEAATVAIDNHMTGEGLLRATGPEAILEVDGKTIPVGGLTGQPNRAFLLAEWLEELRPMDGALRFVGYEVGKPTERMPWKRRREAPEAAWPPKGVSVVLHFEGSGLKADVRYELYDGIPVFAKRLHIKNTGDRAIRLGKFSLESLSLTEAESSVDASPEWRKPNLAVFTDYSFGGMTPTASNRTVYWEAEPEYATQVNYEKRTPCRLVVRPPLGPDAEIRPGDTFDTFTAFTLIHDSTDRERQGLAERRTFRTLAPWAMENPLMLHLTSVDPEVVHRAIDQAAEVGFEMVVISFWSGLDMEDVSPANLAKFKGFVDYAHAKGLELGGYSLLASRRIDDANDAIHPKTGKPGGAIFGNSPCLESEWGQAYFAKITRFLEATGFDLLEHDGSYPGDFCASTTHPGHRGLEDSQWNQYARIAALYRWARERGIYLNVPDNYFLAGSNKTGMGYRESNWSLPRAQQHIHARQNLYDGTWQKTPSMGWMLVPLVEYQGGGKEATIEPLKDHLDDYGLHLANNLGFGAQACYRGPRLFDSPETKAVVVKWVEWFKRHRRILESDVVHLRRADGRRLDGVLHVDPQGETKGMAVIYNPLDTPLTEEFRIPLYFTGLKGKARVRIDDGEETSRSLDDARRLSLKITVKGKSMRWVTFR
ncbi:MAG: alpha-galactosidase [Fimbriimonas sp.]